MLNEEIIKNIKAINIMLKQIDDTDALFIKQLRTIMQKHFEKRGRR